MAPEALVWRDFARAFHGWTGITLADSGATTGVMLLEEMAQQEGMTLSDFVATLEGFAQRENRQRLIDAFVVNTTWFYRENSGLESLAAALTSTDRPAADGPINVWSCGCSTGQEPYQIAMLLADRGVDFRVIATDISEAVLKEAREGVFRPSEAIRSAGSSPYLRRLIDGRIEVAPELRERVSFYPHNVARPPHLYLHGGDFDGIVCRNLLIYFARELAVKVIDRFGEALVHREGFLLLGAAEQPLVWLSQRLQPLQGYGGTLLRPRRMGRPIEVQRVSPVGTPSARARRHSKRGRRATSPGTARAKPQKSTQTPASTPGADIAPAETLVAAASEFRDASPPQPRLFDAVKGRAPIGLGLDVQLAKARKAYRDRDLAGALELVDTVIAGHGLSTAAFLLRGMILKEAGAVEAAIAAFRSARFLEAKDAWMAVYQLGILLETSGDLVGAREAYRHTLWCLERRGRSGWSGDDIDDEVFASITADACRARLNGLRRMGRA